MLLLLLFLWQGQDSVTDCSLVGGRVAVHTSFNAGKANVRQPDPMAGLTDVGARYGDGNLYCKFARQQRHTVRNVTFDLGKGQSASLFFGFFGCWSLAVLIRSVARLRCGAVPVVGSRTGARRRPGLPRALARRFGRSGRPGPRLGRLRLQERRRPDPRRSHGPRLAGQLSLYLLYLTPPYPTLSYLTFQICKHNLCYVNVG